MIMVARLTLNVLRPLSSLFTRRNSDFIEIRYHITCIQERQVQFKRLMETNAFKILSTSFGYSFPTS